jgi:hypothetical protein
MRTNLYFLYCFKTVEIIMHGIIDFGWLLLLVRYKYNLNGLMI